jgi:hypothetical protein
MRTRGTRPKRVAQLGRTPARSGGRAALIVSVPALSLLVPAVAVAIASAGGSGQLTRSAAEISRFLLYYSGVFALIALTAAVAAGLLATDRALLTPDRRIFAQALHRTASLIGVSALGNHIMLEVLAHRARVLDGFVPFMAARSTFYMGLGTVASDLFLVVIVTGAARRRFASGGGRWAWRALHVSAYAAWPLAVLHGLLGGRPAKPYVDWSYGGCLAAVLLALTFRWIVATRGRDAAGPARMTRPRLGAAAAPLGQPDWPPAGHRLGPPRYDPALGQHLPGPRQHMPARGLRALPPGPAAPAFHRGHAEPGYDERWPGADAGPGYAAGWDR